MIYLQQDLIFLAKFTHSEQNHAPLITDQQVYLKSSDTAICRGLKREYKHTAASLGPKRAKIFETLLLSSTLLSLRRRLSHSCCCDKATLRRDVCKNKHSQTSTNRTLSALVSKSLPIRLNSLANSQNEFS